MPAPRMAGWRRSATPRRTRFATPDGSAATPCRSPTGRSSRQNREDAMSKTATLSKGTGSKGTGAPQPRPGIMDIAAYVGGESKIEGVARVIKLASNESALGPSPKAMAAYRALADELHRYPEGGSN